MAQAQGFANFPFRFHLRNERISNLLILNVLSIYTTKYQCLAQYLIYTRHEFVFLIFIISMTLDSKFTVKSSDGTEKMNIEHRTSNIEF